MSPFHLTWRLIWRSTVIWAGVLGLIVLAGIAAYETAYPTESSRQLLVSTLGTTRSLEALYGQARGLDTTGGFVAWRYGTGVSLMAALWALLTVSRILRGEEDAGRTDILVAAPIRARSLLLSQLGAFLVGIVIMAVTTTFACVLGGLPVRGSILFGTVAGTSALMFGAIAAVTSQLFGLRRRAAGWTGAILGASFLIRAVGDGSAGREWLVWGSPIGWTEKLSAFSDPSLWPLLGLLGVPLALLGLSLVLRARRDTGSGLWATTSRPSTRRTTVRSTTGLDWRLARGALIAWAASVGIAGVVLGFLAADIADYAAKDPNMDDLARRFGGTPMSSVEGFLALTFNFVAVVLAVYAGSQMVAGREEEGTGRLDVLLTGGVSRVRWLGARAGVGTMATLVVALVAGAGAWLGAVLSGASTSLGSILAGAANVVPVALLFGGLTIVAFGLWPRLTSAVAFGSVAIAYLVQLVGGIAGAPDWLLDVSPFTHVAPVPYRPVHVTATIVMLASAGVLAALGGMAFRHRDIEAA